MDAARLFGEAIADMLAIGFDLPAQLLQHLPYLPRRRWRCLGHWRAGHSRRHRGLFDGGIAAIRASHLLPATLPVEGGAVTEPGFEFVPGRASQLEQDHSRSDSLPGSTLPAMVQQSG